MKDNNNTTKRFVLKKAVIIPAAAILAVGTATLSVGAATNWNYAEAFRNMFARSYEGNVPLSSEPQSVSTPAIASDTPVTSVSSDAASDIEKTEIENTEQIPERPIGTFDFEKYGKPLDIVMKGDGITATLNGILAYDDLCYIMYTTTATDELLERTGGIVPGLRMDFGNWGFKIDGKIAGGMGYSTETISEEGNTRVGCIEVHYDNVDLAGKTLNITFLSETEAGNPSSALINEVIDIPIDFSPAENVEKELDLELRTEHFDGTINKIKVAGFRTMLYYEGVSNIPADDFAYDAENIQFESNPDDPEFKWYVTSEDIIVEESMRNKTLYDELVELGDAVLTLKDGTTVVAKLGGMRYTDRDGTITGTIELKYTYPLDPADVASITFGDYNITL